MATAIATAAAHCSRKRKRVVLTLEKKLSIVDRLKKGEKQEKLAAEHGVGRSTIGDIKKNQEKLKTFGSTMESLAMSSKGRKVMRMADDEKLDEAVYLWFVQKRSQDFPVSGPILCEKAVQLHAQLHQGDSEAEPLSSK